MALVLACQTSIQRKLNIPIDTLANNVQDVHEIMDFLKMRACIKGSTCSNL
jgi:hypothetical protein